MVCRIAALLTMMIAAAAIAGWVLNSPLLTSVGSSYIPMAPNTAACFFLLGISLTVFCSSSLGSIRSLHKTAQGIVLLVCFIAIFTSAEHLEIVKRSADSMIFLFSANHYNIAGAGKMSFFTAGIFVCASMALWLLSVQRQRELFEQIAFTLSIIVWSLGMLFSFSYLIGSPILYGTSSIPPSLNTSIAFIILGAGITSLALKQENYRLQSIGISIDKIIYTGFSLSLVAVLAISIISYQYTLRSVGAGTTLIRTYTVLEILESLISGEKDAQTAARGYIITREEDFLKPFHHAEISIPQMLDSMRSLSSDDSVVVGLLGDAERFINRHHLMLETGIAMRRSSNSYAPTFSSLSRMEKMTMDSLRILITRIKDREHHRLEHQVTNRKERIAATVSINVTLIGGVLLVFSVIFSFIRRDLTGRHIAEEQLRLLNDDLEQRVLERTTLLRKSEEQHRNTLNNMMEGCQVIDHDFRYLYVNPAAAAHGRSTPEQLVGRTMMEVYPGIEQTSLFAALQLSMKDQIHRQMENEFVFPDGSSGWFNLSLEPVPEGIFILSADITQQKKLKDEVRTYQEHLEEMVKERTKQIENLQRQFKTLFESVPGLYLVLRSDLIIAGASEAYLRATMTKREEIAGRYLFDVFPDNPDDPTADGVRNLHTSLNRVLKTGTSDTMAIQKYDVRTPSGEFEVRYWSPINSPVFSEENKIEFIIHRVEDVTDFVLQKNNTVVKIENDPQLHSRLETMEIEIFQRTQELKKLSLDLQIANRELESFSYSVSHDLRAPLRHINGFIELLQKNAADGLNAKGQRYLSIIADSAKQMGQLIDDLLIFSRMGRTEMAKTTVHLREHIDAVIQSLAEETAKRTITWNIARLPEVSADPAMIRVVIVNLLSNAVKYTRTREHAVIEIGHDSDGTRHIFFVRDNGVGFDMQYKHKLFGVFQRLHSDAQFEGTGIGLANVHRIIQRHGGETWAEGIVNEGAVFYFSLPVKQEGH